MKKQCDALDKSFKPSQLLMAQLLALCKEEYLDIDNIIAECVVNVFIQEAFSYHDDITLLFSWS